MTLGLRWLRLAAVCPWLALAGGAAAQTSDASQAAHAPARSQVLAPATAQTIVAQGPAIGPETNLPLPRFVSLKAAESNVRRGPSLTHRIDWIFQRRHMPLQVVAEYGHWRRVIDRDGMGGWVHYTMLSGNRTVIVAEDMLSLRRQPDPRAHEVVVLEAGVIADLGECNLHWCRVTAAGYRGWAPKAAFWGVSAAELRD